MQLGISFVPSPFQRNAAQRNLRYEHVLTKFAALYAELQFLTFINLPARCLLANKPTPRSRHMKVHQQIIACSPRTFTAISVEHE